MFLCRRKNKKQRMGFGGYSLINNDTILKLGKYVLTRFEHNLNQGTLILFDTNSFDIWFGNAPTNDILKLINGKNTLANIYDTLLPLYEEYSENEVIESFNSVIEELLEKNFLEIKQD